MEATAEFLQTDEIKTKLTITMKLGEWKILVRTLDTDRGYVSDDLRRSIRNLILQAEAKMEGEREI